LLAGLSACSRSGASEKSVPSTAAPAPVVRVARRNLANKLQIASEFMPYQEIDVDAKVSGYIQKLYINWGTHVKQGQLMAVLEVPELEAQVLQDKAAYARSKQELALAQEDLVRAGSAYKVAHLTYTRLYGVQKTRPDLVAQEEVDVAQGKNLEASAAVAGAKDALAAAQEELAVARSALQKDQVMFDYSTMTAPFDGIVTELDAYTGSLLPAGTSTSKAGLPLCHLSQNDLLRLVIPVPSRIVPDVHLGEPVSVQVPSLNRSFQGKVARFSGFINLDTRTMHTEVDVPNPKYVLVPGMYAYVQLPVRSAAHALALPVQAVQFAGHGEGSVLRVNKQNEIEPQQVQLGIQTASEVQIVSGLHVGEQVVFGDLTRFHPGESVKPEAVKLTSLE
ncbi:MAG: efflux RND transporter periplasmic adaptor subunit, partial [Terriglobia bacterium]